MTIGVCAIATVGCSDSTAKVNGGTPQTPLTDGGGIAVGDGGGVGFSGSVSGVLLGRATHLPIGLRQMKVRDAAGKVTDLATDAQGGFSATGVSAPYDLWIAPSGLTPASSNTIYLGLRAPSLRIFGDATETPPVGTNSATLNVRWTMPACGGLCRQYIVIKTSDGSLTRDGHPGKTAGTPCEIPMPMVWKGAAATTADISLMLAGTDGSTHHVASSTMSVTNGQAVANVDLTPALVPTLGSASLTAVSTGTTGFQPADAKVYLQLPGAQGSFELELGSLASPLSFSLPNISGSTLAFASTQAGPPPFNLIGGNKVGVPVAASPQTIELGDPFPVTAPVENGILSINKGRVEFHAVAAPRYRLVTYVPSDRPGFIAIVGAENLSIAKITSIAPLFTGSGELIVEEHARAIDEYVANFDADVTDRFATSSFAIKLDR